MVQGNADSGAVKDLGKPGAGESHARFDEGRLETGSGLGSAEPTMQCVDSAGPPRLPRQSPTLLFPLLAEEAEVSQLMQSASPAQDLELRVGLGGTCEFATRRGEIKVRQMLAGQKVREIRRAGNDSAVDNLHDGRLARPLTYTGIVRSRYAGLLSSQMA